MDPILNQKIEIRVNFHANHEHVVRAVWYMLRAGVIPTKKEQVLRVLGMLFETYGRDISIVPPSHRRRECEQLAGQLVDGFGARNPKDLPST